MNVTDSLIIPIIFIFLSCHEKANDNKEFSCENLKPCCESRITSHAFKPWIGTWKFTKVKQFPNDAYDVWCNIWDFLYYLEISEV